MIFFDIDDTLVDHRSAARAALLELRKRLCDSVEDEQFIIMWNQVVDRFMQRSPCAEFLEEGPYVLHFVLARIGSRVSVEQACGEFERYLDDYAHHWKLFPDVRDCLLALSLHHRLGLISNGSRSIQLKKLKQFELMTCFDTMVVSADIGRSKPSAELFLHACNLAAVSPEESTYVGDSFANDVVGSAEAGLMAVWLNRNHEQSADKGFKKSYVELENLGELQSLVTPVPGRRKTISGI